jgi:RHS repeat-associated protein
MQPALRSPIPDASLAVFPVNGENSHQGLAGRNPAPNQVREVCKFTVLLGMRGQAELNRAGSRCTGKERDTESGNDYFSARYYASSMGRFMSPDFSDDDDGPVSIPFYNPSNPQSMNLYSYVRNSPTTHADSDGHDVNVCDNNGQCHQMTNDQYAAAQKAGNGGLNVPTLNTVGMNGDGSGQFNSTAITDSSGKTVGTATYVSDGPTDFYANRNGLNVLANASATVGSVKGVAAFYGASAAGALAVYGAGLTAGAEATTLGDLSSGLTEAGGPVIPVTGTVPRSSQFYRDERAGMRPGSPSSMFRQPSSGAACLRQWPPSGVVCGAGERRTCFACDLGDTPPQIGCCAVTGGYRRGTCLESCS